MAERGAGLRVDGLVVARDDTGARLLDEVSLQVAPGELVALVGPSGSGKSMTAAAVLGLLPRGVRRTAGAVALGGTELTGPTGTRERDLDRVRGARIGMLHQQPQRMLDPRLTVGAHLRETLRRHRGLRGAGARAAVLELLDEVGLDDPRRCARSHPHQLSGGMAQRVMTALTLAPQPELLLADEPTSALDTLLAAQVLELVDRERRDRGLGVLWITHDLGTVAAAADRVVVLEEGRVRETGPVAEVLRRPRAEITRRLVEAARPAADRAEPGRAEPGPADEGDDDVVTLVGVTKRFGRRTRPALDGLTLGLRRGEVLGVLGRSGSGKSTLARLLVGLETPDAGTVTRRTTSPAPGRGPDTRVQLVPQDPHAAFDPRLSLSTSLEAPLLRTSDLGAAERARRVREAVEEVGLPAELLERRPGQCSGGQLQRVAIARALLVEPEVLVCDEATSALDSLTRRTVLDLLLRLQRERGLTLLVISHDLDVVRRTADRVAVLHHGVLVETGPTTEVFADPRHAHTRELVGAARALAP
jgi:ABC-type glutathione transport system ATPase component